MVDVSSSLKSVTRAAALASLPVVGPAVAVGYVATQAVAHSTGKPLAELASRVISTQQRPLEVARAAARVVNIVSSYFTIRAMQEKSWFSTARGPRNLDKRQATLGRVVRTAVVLGAVEFTSSLMKTALERLAPPIHKTGCYIGEVRVFAPQTEGLNLPGDVIPRPLTGSKGEER